MNQSFADKGKLMGRMLESLRHGSSRPTHECVVDWSMRDAEEVPYIEVGAGKKIEGSAQVMAVKHPPQAPSVQPPHVPAEKIHAPASALSPGAAPASLAHPAPVHPTTVHTAKVVDLTAARPMTVAFEPWPGGQSLARGVAPEIITFHQPDDVVSKQYAALFDRMMEGHSGVAAKTLLLCGCRPQVGASTVLLNLAVTAARGKRRLALLDAHLTRPMLAQRLGVHVAVGLQEVLDGTAALEQAALKTTVPGLFLVAPRTPDLLEPGRQRAACLSAEAVAWLLAWLKERFDLVLIDGPTLEGATDGISLFQHVDGVYLVVTQGEPIQAAKSLAQAISRQGGRLKGIIHTHFDA